MENESSYTFTRAQVEQIAGQEITDEQWEVMSEELLDALDYYFKDETPRLWSDIDSMMAERD